MRQIVFAKNISSFSMKSFVGLSPILSNHGQLQCLRRIRMELENVRSALEWALSPQPCSKKVLSSPVRCSSSG